MCKYGYLLGKSMFIVDEDRAAMWAVVGPIDPFLWQTFLTCDDKKSTDVCNNIQRWLHLIYTLQGRGIMCMLFH